MAMLEQMVHDGVAFKGLRVIERVLDGDDQISSAQYRAAQAALSAEMKARGTRNRDITNKITILKMHPDEHVRSAIADVLIRGLVPEMSANGPVAALEAETARTPEP